MLFHVLEHAEADTFFCFTNLMSDIRDFFIKTLDEAESGINGMMQKFMTKIKQCDPKIHGRLQDQDIKPQYFSFRHVYNLILIGLHIHGVSSRSVLDKSILAERKSLTKLYIIINLLSVQMHFMLLHSI